jgi:hypothetical protein
MTASQLTVINGAPEFAGLGLAIVVLPVPAPCNIMPLFMVTPGDQLADPAGTRTVSPSLAALIALCTAAEESDEAVIVALDALAQPNAEIKSARRIFFISSQKPKNWQLSKTKFPKRLSKLCF